MFEGVRTNLRHPFQGSIRAALVRFPGQAGPALFPPVGRFGCGLPDDDPQAPGPGIHFMKLIFGPKNLG
jgi:hypothetical protein